MTVPPRRSQQSFLKGGGNTAETVTNLLGERSTEGKKEDSPQRSFLKGGGNMAETVTNLLGARST